MSDVIKRFKNEVTLAGKLAELDEAKYGTDKNGKDYIKIRGVIQCGETPAYNRHFEMYINATKKDGSDSKLYATAVKWYKQAVPMTKDNENPTMVCMSGSLQDNIFVQSDGTLVEGTRCTMQFINDFVEYRCDMTLEGYLTSVVPEIIDEKETGRMKFELYTTDNFKNVLHLKNIIVPSEATEGFNNCGYEEGRVAGTLYLEYIPVETQVQSKGGFGKKRTDAKTHTELVLTGAEDAVEIETESDDENIIDREMVKNMITTRKVAVQEVKDKGYRGSKENNTSSSTSSHKSGFGGKKSSAKPSKVEDEDDDELPF